MGVLMNIEEEKDLAGYALWLIKKYDPVAIVAGGAPRDWELGRNCQDIDLWMNEMRNWSMGNYIDMIEREFGEKPKFLGKDYGEMKNDDGHIKYVFSVPLDGKELQIIVVKDTFNLVPRFCCNLSMAWYMGKGRVIPGRPFRAGVAAQELVFNKDTREEYINRMKERFPDYKVKIREG